MSVWRVKRGGSKSETKNASHHYTDRTPLRVRWPVYLVTRSSPSLNYRYRCSGNSLLFSRCYISTTQLRRKKLTNLAQTPVVPLTILDLYTCHIGWVTALFHLLILSSRSAAVKLGARYCGLRMKLAISLRSRMPPLTLRTLRFRKRIQYMSLSVLWAYN